MNELHFHKTQNAYFLLSTSRAHTQSYNNIYLNRYFHGYFTGALRTITRICKPPKYIKTENCIKEFWIKVLYVEKNITEI